MTSEVANVKDDYELNITGTNFLIILRCFTNNYYKSSQTKYTIEINIKLLFK